MAFLFAFVRSLMRRQSRHGKSRASMQDAHDLNTIAFDFEDHMGLNVVAPMARTNLRAVTAKGPSARRPSAFTISSR
jgi:hypothetical protein